jgi:predicted component of type VI protein secretion system
MALPMKLIIEDDEGGRREVPVDREELTIGRKEDNLVHLPERNVSRRHARLWRREGAFVLEDLHSSNGTRVNGVRITEPIELRDGDLVTIGDYGVALRPDQFSLDTPVLRQPKQEEESPVRPEGLADTAPHPLVPEVEAVPVPTGVPVAPRSRKRTVVASAVGLVLGLAAAMVLRAQLDDASTRVHAAAPPPPVQVEEAMQAEPPPPPSDTEPPPLEITPPTVAQRPSTPTEWLSAARAAADLREFDRALKMLGSVRDRVYQADVQTLRRTWRAEASAGRAVKAARHELDQGRPSAALRQLEGAKSSRAWAPEVAVLRSDIGAALKAPKKVRARVASDDPAVPRVKKFLEDSDAQKKARAASAIPQR